MTNPGSSNNHDPWAHIADMAAQQAAQPLPDAGKLAAHLASERYEPASDPTGPIEPVTGVSEGTPDEEQNYAFLETLQSGPDPADIAVASPLSTSADTVDPSAALAHIVTPTSALPLGSVPAQNRRQSPFATFTTGTVPSLSPAPARKEPNLKRPPVWPVWEGSGEPLPAPATADSPNTSTNQSPTAPPVPIAAAPIIVSPRLRSAAPAGQGENGGSASAPATGPEPVSTLYPGVPDILQPVPAAAAPETVVVAPPAPAAPETPVIPRQRRPDVFERHLPARDPNHGINPGDERGRFRRGLDYIRPSTLVARAYAKAASLKWAREEDQQVTAREIYEDVWRPGERKVWRFIDSVNVPAVVLGVMAVTRAVPALRFASDFLHTDTVWDLIGFDGHVGMDHGYDHHAAPSASGASPSVAASASEHAPHKPGTTAAATPQPSGKPSPASSPTPTPQASEAAPTPTEKPSTVTTTTGAPGNGGEGNGGDTDGEGGATDGNGMQNGQTGEQQPNFVMPKNGDGSWTWSDRELHTAVKNAGLDPHDVTKAQIGEVQQAFEHDPDNNGKFYGDGNMNKVQYDRSDADAKIHQIIADMRDKQHGASGDVAGEQASGQPNQALDPSPKGQAVDSSAADFTVGKNEGRFDDVTINVKSGESWEGLFDDINSKTGGVITREDYDKLINDDQFKASMNKFGLGYDIKDSHGKVVDYGLRIPQQRVNDAHPLPRGALEEILDQLNRIKEEEADSA